MSDHERPSTDLAESPQAGSVALTGARSEKVQRPRRPEHAQDQGRPRSKPLILPPARLDQALAAEAARVRREVVGAREHQPEAPAPASARDAVAAAPEAPEAPPEAPEATAPSQARAPEPAPEAPETPEPAPLAGLPTAGVPASQSEELAAALREHPGLAAAFRAAAASAWPEDDLEHPGEPGNPGDPRDPDDVLDDLVPPSTHAQPSAYTVPPSAIPARPSAALRPTGADEPHDDSVAGVAASVIASMRAVGEAHERHLESIELEAGRRSELLTAQAELDAELIRLHARREAHAIIAAARMRTGEQRSPVEADQLREIGETFSRFAESIESSIISGPSSTRAPRDL